jgi:hypothetical protein
MRGRRAVVPVLIATVALVAAPRAASAASVTEVCEDAERLIAAGLVSDARAQLARVRDADARAPCLGAALATLTEQEGIRDLGLERAKVYRRVAALKRGQRLRRARRTAYLRAIRGYITALSRDRANALARRGLRKLIGAQIGPNTAKGANDRCRLASRLTNARLLAEARIVYAKALRTAQTTNCLHGLRRERKLRALAMLRYRRAKLQDAAGDNDKARRAYIAALSADPSLAGAANALSDITPPRSHFPLWNWLRDKGADLAEHAEDAATYVGDHPTAFALLAGLAVALLSGACYLAYWTTDWSRTARRACELVRLRRFGCTRVSVQPFTGTDSEKLGGGASAVLIDVLSRPRVSSEGDSSNNRPRRSSPIDVAPASDSTDAGIEGLLGAFPQAKGITAVITWIKGRGLAKRAFTISGELVPAGTSGLGLSLQIARWSGRRQASRLFWQGDWAPEETDAGRIAYALAVAGAEWTREALT